jgi:hypothetical protein
MAGRWYVIAPSLLKLVSTKQSVLSSPYQQYENQSNKERYMYIDLEAVKVFFSRKYCT